MTIEILTIPLEKLEAMSDAELAAHFAKYLTVTRPAPREGKPSAVRKVVMNRPMRNKIDDALDLLEKMGIK